MLIAIGFPALMFAQGNPFAKFFEKYQNSKGFTSVNVSPDVFEMLASVNGEEDMDKVKNIFKELKGLQVLTFEDNDSTGKAMNYYNEVMKYMPANTYKELVSVNSPDDNVRILTRGQKDGVIDEMLIIVGGIDEFVFVQMQGKLDLKYLGDLSKDMDIKGLKDIDKKVNSGSQGGNK